jgi:hypothetical protein
MCLSGFDVKSGQLWIEGKNVRGFKREEFADVFPRYLAENPLDPLDAAIHAGLSPLADVLGDPASSAIEIAANPDEQGVLAGLADFDGEVDEDEVERLAQLFNAEPPS